MVTLRAPPPPSASSRPPPADNLAELPASAPDAPLAVVFGVGFKPPHAAAGNRSQLLSENRRRGRAASVLAAGGGSEALPAQVVAFSAASGASLWARNMQPWEGPAAGSARRLKLGDAGAVCDAEAFAGVAISGNGVAYVPYVDGTLYALRDANGDGKIADSEVIAYHVPKATFVAPPALAYGILAIVPTTGLQIFSTRPPLAPPTPNVTNVTKSHTPECHVTGTGYSCY